ncbi:MAG: DUF1838 domain-containing protein [Gammaproteobacteria bacterium]|nr:DUF1838 domain-containing protein [Gammaproteobacteria bacterium]
MKIRTILIVLAAGVLSAGCEQSAKEAADATGEAAATAAPSTDAAPAPVVIDPNLPEGLQTTAEQLRAFRRVQCSTVDAEPVTFGWRGRAFSRVEGEKDRHLWNVEGMNIRHCVTVNDPELGAGFRLITREILLYLDPQTNEVLRTWRNPWTGADNQVLHVANDPVNQGPMFSSMGGRDFQMPYQFSGDHWWLTSTIPLFYQNPLGGDYQQYVGGIYHATEMFNFMGDIDSLTSDEEGTADVAVGWSRMSNWLPWMQMSGRQGLIYMHTAGRKLASFDDLPDVMKDEIALNYPEYNRPPPIDDTRKNETSWTYFRKMVESGEFKGSGGDAASGGH